jgi:hypothetical protein
MDPDTYLIAKAVPEIDTLIPPKKKKAQFEQQQTTCPQRTCQRLAKDFMP